jgi:hypothetical protein
MHASLPNVPYSHKWKRNENRIESSCVPAVMFMPRRNQRSHGRGVGEHNGLKASETAAKNHKEVVTLPRDPRRILGPRRIGRIQRHKHRFNQVVQDEEKIQMADIEAQDPSHQLSLQSLTSSNAEYRPDVDGLRAVALTAVIIYHMKHEWLRNCKWSNLTRYETHGVVHLTCYRHLLACDSLSLPCAQLEV